MRTAVPAVKTAHCIPVHARNIIMKKRAHVGHVVIGCRQRRSAEFRITLFGIFIFPILCGELNFN